MMKRFRQFIRSATVVMMPFCIFVLLLTVLIAQAAELSTRSELLPLSSFAILLTFSSVSFGWSRVPYLSEDTLKHIYRAGVDMFVASLLALTAAALGWLASSSMSLASGVYVGVLALHWFFLCLCFVLFSIAIFELLRGVREVNSEHGRPPDTGQ